MRSYVLGAVAVTCAVALSACNNGTPTAGAPTSAAAVPTTSAPAPAPSSTSPAATPSKPAGSKPATSKPGTSKPATGQSGSAKSDLSQLRRLGIDLEKGVLIDVADDGVDRWLQVTKKGVDFTGTKKDDSTMMSLQAAPVAGRNRVLIKPPFYNEDLGAGYCVADTSGAALKLETCQKGRDAQIWTVVPAGDSGQFELKGAYGVIRVDNGKITTGGSGRTGLQTIPFAD